MVYALKSIFLFNYPIWVCILAPFVQMSERSFYNAEIIKERRLNDLLRIIRLFRIRRRQSSVKTLG